MQILTMGLLPQPKFNYRALLTSFLLQTILVTVLIQTGIVQPVKLVVSAEKLVYIPLVTPVDTTPKFQPSIRGYVPPVAKLIVPKPASVIPSPVMEPPKVEMQAKAPTLPSAPLRLPKPVVQVGAFLPSTEKPTLAKSTPAAQVQTGGFGDPNGIKGIGDGKGKLTAPSLGSFGMPSGPGYGNGTGGAHGKTGVGVAVQSSGFSDETASVTPTVKVAVPQHDTGKAVEIVSKPKPLYTEEARQLHLEGEVLLRVKFLTTGEVRVLTVVRSLGHGLDEQAIHVAENIKFKPAEHDGRLIDSEATVHIIFELAS
jgi:TonB family protein